MSQIIKSNSPDLIAWALQRAFDARRQKIAIKQAASRQSLGDRLRSLGTYAHVLSHPRRRIDDRG